VGVAQRSTLAAQRSLNKSTNSPKVRAIIDSERIQEGEALAADRQSFAAMCSKLAFECHVLDRRAIENYLPSMPSEPSER